MRKCVEDAIAIETEYFASGKLRHSEEREAQIHLSISRDSDARRAVALSLADPVLPIQLLRAYIARGMIEEAEELADQMLEKQLTELERCELDLELARIAGLSGDWQQCLIIAQSALSKAPASITQTTLYMVHATAAFEAGEAAICEKSLNQVESLTSLFPYSVSYVFARSMRIRLLAQNKSFKAARKSLDNLWLFLLNAKHFNRKFLLALLRTELYLAREQEESTLNLALAAYQVSDCTGDILYSGMSLLEVYQSIPEYSSEKEKVWNYLLEKNYSKLGRIQVLLKELSGSASQVSAYAQNMGKNSFNGWVDVDVIDSLDRECIFFLQRFNKLIQIGNFQVGNVTSKSLKACEILLKKETTIEELFKHVWEHGKYSPDKNYTAVHALIYRLRKLGLKLEVGNEKVSLKNVLVI